MVEIREAESESDNEHPPAEEEERPPEDEEEKEEREKKRTKDYVQFRRDFDYMKRQHAGVQAESDKLKAQGNQFFQVGCYMQAAMIYSEALELQPDSHVLYCNRSMAYLKQDMPQEALDDAGKSLELESGVENIKAYWRKSQALLELERPQAALEAAEEGMALQGGNTHLNRVRKKAREVMAMDRLVGGEWVGQVQNGIEKRMRFSRDGTMVMTVFGHKVDATFELSVECSPQVMRVSMKLEGPGNGAPPPPPMAYIYEFRDEELWMCHPVGTMELPTAFEGPGFDRLRLAADEPEDLHGGEPMEERCARYMREMAEAMPLMPPQLPAKPSDEEVNEEALLMDKLSKLRRSHGMDVHRRAMELARAPHLAQGPEHQELAQQLQRRLVARKVISQEEVETAKSQAAAAAAALVAATVPQQPAKKAPAARPCCLAGLGRLCGR